MQTNKCKKIKSYSHIKNTYGNNKSNMPSCRVLEHITGGAQRNASSMWCWVTLPVCSALPCPAVLPSGSQQSKFHGKLLFCERCTKCSVLLGADRKSKRRKKREFCDSKRNYVDKWKCHNDDNLFWPLSIALSRASAAKHSSPLEFSLSSLESYM